MCGSPHKNGWRLWCRNTVTGCCGPPHTNGRRLWRQHTVRGCWDRDRWSLRRALNGCWSCPHRRLPDSCWSRWRHSRWGDCNLFMDSLSAQQDTVNEALRHLHLLLVATRQGDMQGVAVPRMGERDFQDTTPRVSALKILLSSYPATVDWKEQGSICFRSISEVARHSETKLSTSILVEFQHGITDDMAQTSCWISPLHCRTCLRFIRPGRAVPRRVRSGSQPPLILIHHGNFCKKTSTGKVSKGCW